VLDLSKSELINVIWEPFIFLCFIAFVETVLWVWSPLSIYTIFEGFLFEAKVTLEDYYRDIFKSIKYKLTHVSWGDIS
jgi:hypothetical protein